MLDRIKTELPKAQVVILTAHDSLHNAIESINAARTILSASRMRRRNF